MPVWLVGWDGCFAFWLVGELVLYWLRLALVCYRLPICDACFAGLRIVCESYWLATACCFTEGLFGFGVLCLLIGFVC